MFRRERRLQTVCLQRWGHANHVLSLLGARLEFNTIVTLFAVALGLGWNRGDGLSATALQRDPVLESCLR